MNDKKRKDAIEKKTAAETLKFQAQWGMKKQFGEASSLHTLCLETETDYIIELNLHEELLSIKNFIDSIRTALNTEPVAEIGDFQNSLVAISLGIAKIAEIKDFGIPVDWQEMIVKKMLSIYYPCETRNNVVEYAKRLGYTTSTYLGQPIVKFNRLYIKIARKKALTPTK